MIVTKYQKWVIIVIGAFMGIFQDISAQTQCDLPNNKKGTCVILDRCPIVKDIIEKAPKPLPTEVENYLNHSKCENINNMNAYCCPNPTGDLSNLEGRLGDDVQNHPNKGLLPTTNCGPINTDKVAGGNQTDLFEFPWMALIKYEVPTGLTYGCGGSIINDRYILTAAHCIINLGLNTKIYSVILGEYDTQTEMDCMEFNDGTKNCHPPTQEMFVEKTIPHENYNNPRGSNDIGLLRLNRQINFNEDHIKPICLPTTSQLLDFNVKSIIVSGWGKTEAQVPSNVLLKAQLSAVDLDDCRAIFRRIQFTDKHLCAKGTGITDACGGDSGSPLVFPSNLNGIKFIQYGIVSAGVKACGISPSQPGVYIRTQKYMDWILDNITN